MNAFYLFYLLEDRKVKVKLGYGKLLVASMLISAALALEPVQNQN